MSILNHLIDRLPIVGAIRHDTGDLTLDLLKQRWQLPGIMYVVTSRHAGCARIGAISYGFRRSIRAAKQFQAGAVDYEVQWSAWRDLWLPACKSAASPVRVV